MTGSLKGWKSRFSLTDPQKQACGRSLWRKHRTRHSLWCASWAPLLNSTDYFCMTALCQQRQLLTVPLLSCSACMCLVRWRALPHNESPRWYLYTFFFFFCFIGLVDKFLLLILAPCFRKAIMDIEWDHLLWLMSDSGYLVWQTDNSCFILNKKKKKKSPLKQLSSWPENSGKEKNTFFCLLNFSEILCPKDKSRVGPLLCCKMHHSCVAKISPKKVATEVKKNATRIPR